MIAQGLEDAAEVTRVYVDATYGRGGHSRALLAHLYASDRLVAIDRDTAAVAAGQTHANSDPRLLVCHGRFSQLRRILDDLSGNESGPGCFGDQRAGGMAHIPQVLTVDFFQADDGVQA